jgi:hypothetical protein
MTNASTSIGLKSDVILVVGLLIATRCGPPT